MKNEKLEDIWGNIKLYVPLICVFLFFVAGAVVCFYNCNSQIKKQNAIDGGVKVSATIVNVDAYTWMTTTYIVKTDTTFETKYEYVDSDGTVYSGTAMSGFRTREEAEKYLNTKVEIYIDGHGNSIVVGKKTNSTSLLIMGIVTVILGMGVVAFIIWSKIPYRKKNSNNSNLDIVIEAEDTEPKNKYEEITTDILIEREDEKE